LILSKQLSLPHLFLNRSDETNKLSDNEDLSINRTGLFKTSVGCSRFFASLLCDFVSWFKLKCEKYFGGENLLLSSSQTSPFSSPSLHARSTALSITVRDLISCSSFMLKSTYISEKNYSPLGDLCAFIHSLLLFLLEGLSVRTGWSVDICEDLKFFFVYIFKFVIAV
jgi:hypothetical protein